MLQSVQHLFLSTESPSPPWVETKTQRKRCVSPPSTGTEEEGRRIPVVTPRPRFPRAFPSSPPPDSLLPGPSLSPPRPRFHARTGRSPCSFVLPTAQGLILHPRQPAPSFRLYSHPLAASPKSGASPAVGHHAPVRDPKAVGGRGGQPSLQVGEANEPVGLTCVPQGCTEGMLKG